LKPKKKMTVSAYSEFDKSDPLWDNVPAMGVEGLISTMGDKQQLVKELVKLSMDTKKLMRKPKRSRAPIHTDAWYYG
jgi:hypothetical protein